MIVRRSLAQHLLSTLITALSVALGTGLVMSVFAINAQTRKAFTGGDIGFDAVLGARGSQLQIILNSIFHLETSPGNITWEQYKEIRDDRRVKRAVPIAVGDNYHGFRIVGTTEKVFDNRYKVREGGRLFDASRREAVVGSFVAAKTGLALNSKFNPYHGLIYDKSMRHKEEYVVVGVLEPTNSPADRVIWIPIEGIFRMEGHVLRGTGEEFIPEAGQEIPDEHKEASAVLLEFRSKQVGITLDHTINRQGKVATLAWPIGKVMGDLFDKMGWIHRILTVVAYLVVVVAAGSILASIYNTINERRREIAILRALGAKKRTVFTVIVLEATAIAAIGTIFGYVVYAIILGSASLVVRAQTGVVLDVLQPHMSLYLAPLGMIAMGAAAGLLPAFRAYKTDVAEHIIPTS